MSFICLVCHEALTTNPDGEKVRGQVNIVSTKCGHLFHEVCLTRWFNSQGNPRQRSCPTCRTLILGGYQKNGFHRIFPVGDEELTMTTRAGPTVERHQNRTRTQASESKALRRQTAEIPTRSRNLRARVDALAGDIRRLGLGWTSASPEVIVIEDEAEAPSASPEVIVLED